MTTCHKCGKVIGYDEEIADWTAEDGTACGGDVTYRVGDPVFGHHEPDDEFIIASELGLHGLRSNTLDLRGGSTSRDLSVVLLARSSGRPGKSVAEVPVGD